MPRSSLFGTSGEICSATAHGEAGRPLVSEVMSLSAVLIVDDNGDDRRTGYVVLR